VEGGFQESSISSLILVVLLFLTLIIGRLDSNLFVILLHGGEILTSFREFSFLHTLTDVPVDEGTLGEHKIELVIHASKDLTDGGGVGNHEDGALNLGKVTTGDNGGRLVVDTDLEGGGAPVDETDGTLQLDGRDGGVDILGDNITTVHHAASHVLSVTGITLDHLVEGLEHRVGDLGNGKTLVVGNLGGDDGSVGEEGEADTGVGDQVGLELSEINVKGTIETKRSGDGGDTLGDQTVEVGVGGALNLEGAGADVVEGLVIDHEGDIGVLVHRVSTQDGVVRLNNSGGNLGRGVDGELDLGLLSVVDGETLKKERTETGSGTSSEGMEDHESLKTGTLVSELADAVEDKVDDLLSDGVVTTGVVVGGILLSRDELLGVEEVTVRTGTDLIDNGGLEVDHEAAGNVLAGTSLSEKGVGGLVVGSDGTVGGKLTVGLDSVLEAQELPAGHTGLDTGLSNVNRNALSHCWILKV